VLVVGVMLALLMRNVSWFRRSTRQKTKTKKTNTNTNTKSFKESLFSGFPFAAIAVAVVLAIACLYAGLLFGVGSARRLSWHFALSSLLLFFV